MSRLGPCRARISGDRHTHRQTDTQTHKPSTVTLAAHARRGLIMGIIVAVYILQHICWKLKVRRYCVTCEQSNITWTVSTRDYHIHSCFWSYSVTFMQCMITHHLPCLNTHSMTPFTQGQQLGWWGKGVGQARSHKMHNSPTPSMNLNRTVGELHKSRDIYHCG